MTSVDCDVLIVGAGPTGTLLAAELRSRGVDVALLERRPEARAGTRAIGVHPPVLAALEGVGATERILADAARITRGVASCGGTELGDVRFDRLGTRFPFIASVPQAVTEEAVGLQSPEPLRGFAVTGVHERGDQVVVRVRTATGETSMRARAVVVATGANGRELVRPLSRIRERRYDDRYLMADVAHGGTQPPGTAVITLDAAGVLESFPLTAGGRRLVLWDGQRASGRSPRTDTDRLRQAVASRTGDSALAERIEGATSFGIRQVLVDRMRRGRVFVIGDAAHEVSPIGGQGLNLGLLDAATLAPRLARWLRAPSLTAEVDQWEKDRIASARTAARLARWNTLFGRGRSPAAHRAIMAALRPALGGPQSRTTARLFAMGFDRAAATLRGRR